HATMMASSGFKGRWRVLFETWLHYSRMGSRLGSSPLRGLKVPLLQGPTGGRQEGMGRDRPQSIPTLTLPLNGRELPLSEAEQLLRAPDQRRHAAVRFGAAASIRIEHFAFGKGATVAPMHGSKTDKAETTPRKRVQVGEPLDRSICNKAGRSPRIAIAVCFADVSDNFESIRSNGRTQPGQLPPWRDA